jgi:PAS domain S-box-containing protein
MMSVRVSRVLLSWIIKVEVMTERQRPCASPGHYRLACPSGPSGSPPIQCATVRLDVERILAELHEGVIVTDMDGVIVAWTAAAERVYGYAPAEVVGRHVSLVQFPEDTAMWSHAVCQMSVHGTLRTEVRHRHKDGRELHVSMRLSLQREAAGGRAGIIVCVDDVTDQRRALEALRRQESELQLMLDAVPAMIWYKDRHNRILRANRGAAESIERSAPELVGVSTYDLYPEEAAKYHQDDLEVIATGQAKTGIVEQLQTASGEKRWVRTDKIPYRNDQGEIVGVIVFAVDISDHKRAEAALELVREELEQRVLERTAELSTAVATLRAEMAERRKTEERLELALWATGLGLWDWDVSSGRVVTDELSALMLGYTYEQFVPLVQDWQRLIHPDDRVLSQRSLLEYLERPDPTAHIEVEHRLRHHDGEYRWLQTRGKAVEWSADGRVQRMAGTHRDITARKLLEEQIRRQQAELAHVLRLQTVEGIAAELAHEINQPLAAIANFANGIAARLRRGGGDREAMLEAAEQIGTQALRAGEVLQRLRSFVRKEAPLRVRSDVDVLVRDAAALIESDLRRHRIQLHLRLADGLPVVSADPVQIEQVILNLARNGLEAMLHSGGESGALTISAGAAEGGVRVTVHDTGGGLSRTAQERLFEPFFTTRPGGLGMGLSISRSIIEAHGGRLVLTASSGLGTTFAFTLPAADCGRS